MTSDERAAIRQMIERHTKEATANQQTARESLIREGVYTTDGNLTEQYGGKKMSSGR